MQSINFGTSITLDWYCILSVLLVDSTIAIPDLFAHIYYQGVQVTDGKQHLATAMSTTDFPDLSQHFLDPVRAGHVDEEDVSATNLPLVATPTAQPPTSTGFVINGSIIGEHCEDGDSLSMPSAAEQAERRTHGTCRVSEASYSAEEAAAGNAFSEPAASSAHVLGYLSSEARAAAEGPPVLGRDSLTPALQPGGLSSSTSVASAAGVLESLEIDLICMIAAAIDDYTVQFGDNLVVKCTQHNRNLNRNCSAVSHLKA